MKAMRSNRGTSIVEVLVVMVVLLVGIMTIVRLFPPGFGSVRHAESMTFAGRLAQYEMERWKSNSENLPDGLLPIDNNGVVMNDLSLLWPLDDTKVGCVRRVIGETTRIPFSGWSTKPTSAGYYMLAFAPVDIGSSFAVRGGELSRRIFDSSNTSGPQPWQTLRVYQYGIDYGHGNELPKLCFRASDENRIYYMSCSWWEQVPGSDPVLRSVTSLKIDVPANSGWIEFDDILINNGMTPPSNFIGMQAYSDTVSRGFVEIPANQTWSAVNPYEYKLIDSVLGIISFNPAGYSRTEFGRRLEAKIDYDILDLEIIREEKRVPDTPPYRINLTLNRIKQINVSMLPNGEFYKGICPSKWPATDLLAVDMESTLPIAIKPDWINYKDGIIEFPEIVRIGFMGATTYDICPAGRNIRFLYKAEGDWSLQFHKAYTFYERDPGAAEFNYKAYDILSTDPKRIFFAACNAGNTIAVDYEYEDTSTGQLRKIVGESHKASDAFINDKTYVDLKYEPTRVFSVYGVSARARAVWREGERWRHIDLDTVLVKKPND